MQELNGNLMQNQLKKMDNEKLQHKFGVLLKHCRLRFCPFEMHNDMYDVYPVQFSVKALEEICKTFFFFFKKQN